MSLVPETWSLVGKATDEEGRRVCFVSRVKHDIVDRKTTWRLVEHPNSWYSEGQWTSKGPYRRFPEAKGVRLTDSRIDQTLLGFATR